MKAKDHPAFGGTAHLTTEYKENARLLDAAKRGNVVAAALLNAKKGK